MTIRKTPHIHRLKITPDVSGHVAVHIFMNKSAFEQTVRLIVRDPGHNPISEWQAIIDADSSAVRTNFIVQAPELWAIDQPNLYTLEAHLANGDRLIEKFGFRSFEARDGQFLLNGEPIYIRAALDQDFYPQTIYSSPSEEYLRDEMIKARQLGLNMLRCHIKVPDPLYLKVADELGLLVWYEVPNWDVFTPAAGQRASRLADAMLERDWNHPSLVIISLINESWGLDLGQAGQRNWLLNEFNRVKNRAVNRLVVDNSACWGNFHMKTDINDYHTYWAIPENRHRFTQTVSDFSQRPDWLFSKYGDAIETGKEPLMLSEFGNWGLPVLPDKKPWWLGRDFLGRAVTLPTGYLERFKAYGYGDMFKTYDDLAKASQRNQFTALKWEIEEIRRFQEIQGYVITEFTDLNWECNGLLDMWRNFKVYHDELSDIQQSDLIIPRPRNEVIGLNQPVVIDLWLSHYSPGALKDTQLRWHTDSGQKGEILLPVVAGAGLHTLPEVRIPEDAFSSAGNKKIIFVWTDRQGKTLSQNFAQIYVVPEFDPHPAFQIEINDPDGSMPNISALAREINANASTGAASVMITRQPDASVMTRIQAGAPALCLVNGQTISPDTSVFKIISRESEWYDGNWASNLNWLRNHRPPFRDLEIGPVLGFEIADMAPQYVIGELDSSHFADVLAGMYVGWIHLNSGYIVQMKSGKGRLLLCTFPLEEAMGSQPLAEKLLRNLLAYLSGDKYIAELEI